MTNSESRFRKSDKLVLVQESELNKSRVRLTSRERSRFRGIARVWIRVRVGVLMVLTGGGGSFANLS